MACLVSFNQLLITLNANIVWRCAHPAVISCTVDQKKIPANTTPVFAAAVRSGGTGSTHLGSSPDGIVLNVLLGAGSFGRVYAGKMTQSISSLCSAL